MLFDIKPFRVLKILSRTFVRLTLKMTRAKSGAVKKRFLNKFAMAENLTRWKLSSQGALNSSRPRRLNSGHTVQKL